MTYTPHFVNTAVTAVKLLGETNISKYGAKYNSGRYCLDLSPIDKDRC